MIIRILCRSQILGFFFAGIVLNQLGIIRNLTDVKVLSEWGILFLVSTIANSVSATYVLFFCWVAYQSNELKFIIQSLLVMSLILLLVFLSAV